MFPVRASWPRRCTSYRFTKACPRGGGGLFIVTLRKKEKSVGSVESAGSKGLKKYRIANIL